MLIDAVGEAVMKRSGRPRTKLTEDKVRQIRRESQQDPNATIDQLGKKYGVSITTITAIVKGKIWKPR
jgi:transposase